MKKTIRTILLLKLVGIMLLANLAIVASATDSIDPSPVSLEKHLIGTWRWEATSSSWRIIFREDGTMLDGPSSFRTIYNWQAVNDRLIVNGIDWNIRLTDNAITVDRYGQGNNTHTYIWYSDSTEGETSFTFIWLILIVLLIPVGVIVLIVVLVRKRKRKQLNRLLEQSSGTSLVHISSKPSFIADLIILIINIFIDISLLLSGRFFWFFLLLFCTILPASRLIKTLRSGIVVGNAGIFVTIKKEKFQMAYHEISSVSITDNRELLIVSGYQSRSIRIRNVRAIRDAISHNMEALAVAPAPMKTPVLRTSDALYVGNDSATELSVSLERQITEIYDRERTELPDEFYAFDNIPSQKLENAKKSYAASLGSDEQVIFFYDDTVRGSAKTGFMLTSKYLYGSFNGTEVEKIYIGNIVRISQATASKLMYFITVEMKDERYTDFIVGALQRKISAIVRTLDETISLLNSNSSAPSESNVAHHE
ncbi:MAG: hypothetical protein FWE28_05780 [Oscillospiraceae bacterium]|nr:hypothetical protein [Oscillospiraceae bacterium]